MKKKSARVLKLTQQKLTFEAGVIKKKRISLKFTTTSLAKKLSCSQSAVARVESGDNGNGEIKFKMVIELFKTEENFKKRVSDLKRVIREISPSLSEGFEKYNIEKTKTSQSYQTLNDINLRREIYANFFNGDINNSALTIHNVGYEKFINQIENLLISLNKWHKLNKKINRSEIFFKNFKKEKEINLKKGKYSIQHARLIMPSNFEIRLKNLFTLEQLKIAKKSYGYAGGKKGKIFIREFIFQLYKVFKPFCNKEEALKYVYRVLRSYSELNDIVLFNQYKYLSDLIDEKIITERANDELDDLKIIKNIIDEASKNNPIKSIGCRVSLDVFMYLQDYELEKVTPHFQIK